eukprot:3354411-Rhodomonas_salina.1
MRNRNQQEGTTAQAALALAADVEKASEQETGDTDDEFDSADWVGDLSRSTEEEFPLRSPDPPTGMPPDVVEPR